MATIDTRSLIDLLIANNGYYPQEPDDIGTPDPRVIKIVEYTNAYGKVTWGIVYEIENPVMQMRYEIETEYVRNPRVIWSAK